DRQRGHRVGRERAGDVDPFAAGFEHGLAGSDEGAALERLHLDGAVETRIQGERDDHTTTTRGPAFSMSSASSGSSPVSVMTVSTSVIGATRAKSSRPNLL